MTSSSRAWTRLGAALATVAALAAAGSRPAAAQHTTPAPLTPFARQKVEALLRDRLPCLGCHTLAGQGGRVGPDLTSVAERRSSAYIAAIIADPQRTVPGTVMPGTPMPDEMRALVVRYLQAPSAPGAGASARPVAASPAAATPAAEVDGASLFRRHCAVCHGSQGAGDGPNAAHLPVSPAVLSDRAAMSRRPDDSLYDTIAGGGWIMNRSARMPAFGATLSRTQITALVRHIRALCRCQGPAWSTDGAPRR